MAKWALIINGIVDTISYDPPRERVSDGYHEPILGEDGQPTGETQWVETGWHWGDVLPPWVSVPDDTYGGYIQNPDGTFSPPPVIPPPDPTEWTIPADVPWARMTEEEADDIDAGIQASPVKTRNMINKATSFTTGTEAFTKFFAIIEAATSATRAHEIMKWLDESELAARAPEAPAEM